MLGLWLAIAIAAAPEAAETAEVQLTAERILHDGKQELSTAEGRAKLVTEGSAVDADRIVYDKNKRIATAVGHVVARITQGGKIAVVADLMTLILDERQEVKEVYLYDGQAISKKDVSAEKLLAASTAEEVERAGTTQALLEGNHLVRDGPRWTVERLALVPCECDFKNPAWSITSTEATVDTEADRVAVTNAIIRIKSIPILWLPWLSLPLTERQSGLLFPRPGYNPNFYGFALDQPVYFTLGRSADLTVTPGFFTGAADTIQKVNTDDDRTVVVGRRNLGPPAYGVAGPRLGVEFRYTPSRRINGRIVLGLIYDFRTKRDVANPGLDLVGTYRGLRGELGLQHVQDFELGFGLRADVNAHSDGFYNRDITVDVIASSATYLRSGVTAFHRGDTHWIGLDVGLRQDIQWGYDWLGQGVRLSGANTFDPAQHAKFGPGTLQRLPAFSFGWTPDRTLGPVRFELEGDAVRLAPLFSVTGDEGRAAAGGRALPELFASAGDRLFSPSLGGFHSLGDGTGDRVWQPGEREARDRLMVMPKVSVAGQLFEAISASAFASWRQLAWYGEASGTSWSRGYLLVGGRLETEFSRRFDSVRHVIQPLAEVRGVVAGVEGGAGAPVAYDAMDAAVPNIRPRYQGVLELRQRLMRGGEELLRLDVGQGFELSGVDYAQLQPTFGEAYGRLGARLGFFSASGLLRADPLARRMASDGVTEVAGGGFTRAAGRLEFDDGKHGLWGAYERVLVEGSMRSRQPLDLLFLVDRGYTSATSMNQFTFGGRWDFGPIALGYSALVGEHLVKKFPDDPMNSEQALAFGFTQHLLSVGIAPACDCWRVDLVAVQQVFPTLRVPDFRFNVTISKFGSIGSR
jgi:LPS-assembly protein